MTILENGLTEKKITCHEQYLLQKKFYHLHLWIEPSFMLTVHIFEDILKDVRFKLTSPKFCHLVKS